MVIKMNPQVEVESYIEHYELKLPKKGYISKYDFKELYKLCCGHLGYGHQL